MATVNIKIKNLAEIRSAFQKSPHLMTNNLNTAIRRVIVKIGGDSRKFTPVDTGRLRGSHREQFSNLKGKVSTNTEYDVFVHEGTKFMEARPFLQQAVETNEQFTDREFERAVQKTLDEIAREIG